MTQPPPIFSTLAEGAEAPRRPGCGAEWLGDMLNDKGIRPYVPGQKSPRATHQARQASLKTALQDRDDVRKARGLASRRDMLRKMPEGLRCRNRHALTMMQEPNLTLKTHTEKRSAGDTRRRSDDLRKTIRDHTIGSPLTGPSQFGFQPSSGATCLAKDSRRCRL